MSADRSKSPMGTGFLRVDLLSSGRRHSSGSEAPPKGSTLDKLIVDTYPVGCEAPPEGLTPGKLIVETRVVAKHHRRGRLQLS